jgi:hypothetical protein
MELTLSVGGAAIAGMVLANNTVAINNARKTYDKMRLMGTTYFINGRRTTASSAVMYKAPPS